MFNWVKIQNGKWQNFIYQSNTRIHAPFKEMKIFQNNSTKYNNKNKQY